MKLVIFTEAGKKKGMGHFIRTSGICDYCIKNGVDASMYLESDGQIDNLLKRPYVTVLEWTNNQASFNKIEKEDIVLIDSYHVSLSFLIECKNFCRQLIVIDDNRRLDYSDMIILNPNYFAETLNYPQDRGNTYLLGKDYTLLRPPFYMPMERTVKQNVKNVLITLGGTDVRELTHRVVFKMKEYAPDVKLHIVATDAYSNLDRIKNVLTQKDSLYLNIDALKMRELMLLADFAIAASGGTSNELIKTQCPSALFVVADNQVLNSEFMKQYQLAQIVTEDEMRELERMFSYQYRADMVKKLSSMASKRSGTEAILKMLKGEKDV